RKNFDEMEIARNFLSPNEILELTSLPAAIRKKGFYNCWTRKEAYIKGRGKGLSIPLDSFDVSLAPGKSALLNRSQSELEDSEIWQLLDLKLERDYVGAAAFEGRNRRIMLWEWEFSAINEQEG
ncbi:MAG: 4'-phosphopantetheinyl transferase superfamily protein, partial [Calditrichia bacterium]